MGDNLLRQEIEKVKELRDIYNSFIGNPNSSEAIEAYHNWYDASNVLFHRYFDEKSKEYQNFSNVDNDGNGFVLCRNYQCIRKDFCVLIDLLERGEVMNIGSISSEKLPAKTSVSGKRIFISHASKDSQIIDKFVDSILLLGLGIDSNDIAYTSRDETGIPLGKSIPQFIQENINSSDVFIMMLSDNYKNSEVCLNEMGGAWALDKYMVQVLLPNTTFDKLGWLCSWDKAIKIDVVGAIDSLCEIISERLDIKVKLGVLNRNIANFMSYCQSLSMVSLPAMISYEEIVPEDIVEEELGFLDYKELLDEDAQKVTVVCVEISNAVNNSADVYESCARKLTRLNSNNPNPQHVRGIMMEVSIMMDNTSDVFEVNTPQLCDAFHSMVDNAIKLIECSGAVSSEDKDAWYAVVQHLLVEIMKAKNAVQANKQQLDDMPKTEKSIIKSKKRLSKNMDELISALDECVLKGQRLLARVL